MSTESQATAVLKELGTNVRDVLKKYDDLEEIINKNQPVIDSFLAEKQKSSLFGSYMGGNKSVASSIETALANNNDNLQKLARGELKSFQMDLKAVGDMTFGVNFGSASSSVANVRTGIIENANRPLHIRDLVPRGTMDGSNFVYLKEGTSEGAITTVEEGNTKAQIDFDLSEILVPAEYLAGWLRISTKMLDDVKSMRLFLSNRLMEALLVVEDAKLLNGTGVAPNPKGINTAGNFTAATTTATVHIEQIIETIAQLASMGRRPDGLILHPNDYYNLILNKSAGSGEYDMPDIVTISENGGIRIGGAPVVWTVAQSEGTFTIGDFSAGSLLLFREPPRIEFFAQDGTNVRENKITVRIEERIAFAVFAATYFVKGTLEPIE